MAIECSPNNDVASNPAKDLALMLADALPLVWGGSVLAARAARRVVEALRLASGRPALAADAGHLLPVLNQPPRDLFADPFDKPEELRPGLVILDDGVDDPGVAEHRRKLEAKAERNDVRVHVVTQADGTDIARYAALTQHGRYAAAYLGIGLGRYGTPADSDPGEPGNPVGGPGVVVRLQNTIRDYAWGSRTAIPELTGVEPDGEPQAELWMGAHESARRPCCRRATPCTTWCPPGPSDVLGAETAERFDGRFPFLAKLLAAAQPLSIQAHPSREQAIDGYARDEAAGIPRDAADRNYKDAWPKPEILIALGPFDALVGFRPLEADRGAAGRAGAGRVRGARPTCSRRRQAPGRVHADHEQRPGRDPPAGRRSGEACARYAGDGVRAGARRRSRRLCAGLPGRPRRTGRTAAEPGPAGAVRGASTCRPGTCTPICTDSGSR